MSEYYMKGLKLLSQLIFSNPGRGVSTSPASSNPGPVKATEAKPRGASTCIPCSIDHTATVCGVLNESLRFARRDNISNPEVQLRIAKAEEELNTMERLDLDAQEIAKLPEKQRRVTNWLAVQSKSLRDRLKSIHSLDELEQVTADACGVRLEFRAKSLGLPQELVEISAKVGKGELSAEEAKEKIKALMSPGGK